MTEDNLFDDLTDLRVELKEEDLKKETLAQNNSDQLNNSTSDERQLFESDTEEKVVKRPKDKDDLFWELDKLKLDD